MAFYWFACWFISVMTGWINAAVAYTICVEFSAPIWLIVSWSLIAAGFAAIISFEWLSTFGWSKQAALVPILWIVLSTALAAGWSWMLLWVALFSVIGVLYVVIAYALALLLYETGSFILESMGG